ncbi:zinc-binding dehydrogenase [Flavobacteriaceae bacterium Ap0902]|nr:zinc-binding dehydrogenase [Flavobacteriaceae bacterium Ap0902]
MNKTILLKNRPEGKPEISDFEFTNMEKPTIKEGEILLETKYISVDPYLRGRMKDADSYVKPFQLNEPISSGIIAEVIESKNESYQKGDYISGNLEWKQYQASNGDNLLKVDPSLAPLSAYLGILGMTGLTAYFGLTEIGRPKKGETLVVSGAAGAVGSVVGQIGKLLGCRVVGIAGTDEKVEMLKSKFGFDAGINYNESTDMAKDIASATPDGVDIYFDNVGGSISDHVHAQMNRFSRVIVCGAISTYNETSIPMGPRVEQFLIKKSALMQGFLVGNYADQFPEGVKQLATWLKEGKLSYTETVLEGFNQVPEAFIGLFDGKNKGKMIVKA